MNFKIIDHFVEIEHDILSCRILATKWNTICEETNKPVLKGDICLYDPMIKRVYHQTSTKYLEYQFYS